MVTCLMEIEGEEKLGHRLHNGHLPDGGRGGRGVMASAT